MAHMAVTLDSSGAPQAVIGPTLLITVIDSNKQIILDFVYLVLMARSIS